jgi:hypothetical protein
LRAEFNERCKELCELAVAEQDPDKFIATIQELIQVLESDERPTPRPDQRELDCS